jgi:hypothetical protein
MVQNERAGVAGFVWVGLSKLLWLDDAGGRERGSVPSG